MIINTENYPDFVANMQIEWRKGYDRVNAVAKKLYDVSFNQKLTTDHSSMDGFTFAEDKDEGDDNYEANPEQNYKKTITKYRIGITAKITWEMRTYDRYTEMSKALKGLGEATRQRLEIDLTHRFTFGTATSYTNRSGRTISTVVGDGYQLFYSAHEVNGSSSTYRNRIANNPSLSKGGLQAGRKLFSTQMIDSAGNKVVIMPNALIIADNPEIIDTAKELLKSKGDPTGAHEGVYNPYLNTYDLIILPYLATDNLGGHDSDKEDYWMLADLTHTDAVLEISEAPHMSAPKDNGALDFANDNLSMKSNAAYGIEIIDPKFIVFSDGLGTA